ncbi:MAG TPA: F-box-like domain-containing protein [Candidatus Babeliaceae bacterium]|nr:F-box-like domain-containing protein [Candidatus Babeliaceae bacterium]
MAISNKDPRLCGLPYEIWYQIGTWLPASSLCALAPTCHVFHQLNQEHSLWKLLFSQDYPHLTPQKNIGFKHQYKVAKQADFNLTHGLYELMLPKEDSTIQASYGSILFEGFKSGLVKKFERDAHGTYRLLKKLSIYEAPVDSIYFSHGYLFVKFEDGHIGISHEESDLPVQVILPPHDRAWGLKIEAFDGKTLLLNFHCSWQVWNKTSENSFELCQTLQSVNLHLDHYLFYIKRELAEIPTRAVYVLKKSDKDGVFYENQSPIKTPGIYRIVEAVDHYLFLSVLEDTSHWLLTGLYIRNSSNNSFVKILKRNLSSNVYEEFQTLESSLDTLLYYNSKHKDLFLFTRNNSLQIYTEGVDRIFHPQQNLGQNQVIIYFQDQSDYLITQYKEEKIHIWKRSSEGLYEEYALESKSQEEQPLVSLTFGDEEPRHDSDIIAKTLSLEGHFLIATSVHHKGTRVKVWENDQATRTFRKVTEFQVALHSGIHLYKQHNLLFGRILKINERNCRIINMAASPLDILKNIAQIFAKYRPCNEHPKQTAERFFRLPKAILDKIPLQLRNDILQFVQDKDKEETSFWYEEDIMPDTEEIGQRLLKYIKALNH